MKPRGLVERQFVYSPSRLPLGSEKLAKPEQKPKREYKKVPF